MKNLIEIKRDNKKIILTILAHPIRDGGGFLFPVKCSSAWSAELLKNFLNESISFALSQALHKAYDAGWRESHIPKWQRHYIPPNTLEIP